MDKSETLGSQLLTKIFAACKDVAFTEEGELEDSERFLEHIRDLEKEGKPWPIPVEMLKLYVNTLPKDVDHGEYLNKILKNPRKYDKQRIKEFLTLFLKDIAPEKVNRCAYNDCTNVRNLKRCKKCQIFSYCSAQCQKKDWRNHKSTCCILYEEITSKMLI
jgi:hypothetical protein